MAEAIARVHPVAGVGVEELHALRADADRRTLYVFDVRSAAEYANGHIPGSLWVAGGQLVQATDDFVAVHGVTIVLVCDGTGRATLTGTWLRRMGFADVRIFIGGVPAWRRAGQVLERGVPSQSVQGLADARMLVSAVDVASLAAWLRDPSVMVLDVSTSIEHAHGHVPGARWVSRGWLETAVAREIPNPRATIVVTCPTGEHSTLAAATLARLGYSRATSLEGGMRAWMAADQATATGLEAPLVEPNDVALLGILRGDTSAMQRYLQWEIALVPEGEEHPRR